MQGRLQNDLSIVLRALLGPVWFRPRPFLGKPECPGVVAAEKLPLRPAYLQRLRPLHSSLFNASNTW